MAQTPHRGRKLIGGLVLLLLLAGTALVWTERTELLAWFFVRGLARANDATRDRWVDRVVSLGEAAIPELLDTLADANSAACANAGAALTRLGSDWGMSNAHCATLAGDLARDWDNFSVDGKACALEAAANWFVGDAAPAPGLITACARLLTVAVRDTDAELQLHALDLCAVILPRPGGSEVVSPGRSLVRACLGNANPSTRLLAIRLSLYPGMDLLEDVATLLNDTDVEVRRAAVMVVGPAEQAVRDETLLPCLHDPDPEVRRLCELALSGRGLRPEHIKLGRILTDSNPEVRVQVLDYLRSSPDLDAGIWLRRLSHDPAESVRAATIRAISEQSAVDLTDRIDQMARNDPSPTVCKLARYYLPIARAASAEQ